MIKAERAVVDRINSGQSQSSRPETALSSSCGPVAGLQLIEDISFLTLEWDLKIPEKRMLVKRSV